MQRYFARKKGQNSFLLDDLDLHHIRHVMRMRNHDLIEVVFDQTLYLCEIDQIESNIQILLKERKKAFEESIPKVTLIIPLLKEQKMDLILQKATELGVDQIIPIITTRSMIHLDSKRETKKLERWNRICKEASEQAHRLSVPILSSIKTIEQLGTIDGVKFVCSTFEKKQNLKKLLKKNPKCDKISIAIGPEGGFSIQEEEQLNKQGFDSITLGNRIMRVETVPLFVLSIINYEFME